MIFPGRVCFLIDHKHKWMIAGLPTQVQFTFECDLHGPNRATAHFVLTDAIDGGPDRVKDTPIATIILNDHEFAIRVLSSGMECDVDFVRTERGRDYARRRGPHRANVELALYPIEWIDAKTGGLKELAAHA